MLLKILSLYYSSRNIAHSDTISNFICEYLALNTLMIIYVLFQAMARKNLNLDEITDLLYGAIPLYYEGDTDESDDETDIGDMNNVHDEQDNIVVLNDTAVIIVGNEVREASNASNLQSINTEDDNSEDASSSRRRRKKKAEPCCDSTFSPLSKKDLSCSKPIDFFFKYIDQDLLDIIHYQSNLKSVQNGKPVSIITPEKTKVFLGIIIMMGYHQLPSIQNYWSSATDLGLAKVKDAMSRDRFPTILSNLHLNDNSKLDPNNMDRLFKFRPFLEHLKKTFLQN